MRSPVSSAALWLALFLSASPSVADTPKPATPTTAPAATGRSHSCLHYYSSTAIENHEQGATHLAFTIGDDGVPHDLSVTSSSGHADLDNAALTCAKGWLYVPATRDGKPVAVPWGATVTFTLFDGGRAEATNTPPPTPTDPAVLRLVTCDAWYPAQTTLSDPIRPTIVTVAIAKDGHVHDAKIAASNGGAEFDSAAIACANQIQLKPITADGKPVEIDWKIAIKWRKGGPSYYTIPHIPLFCRGYPETALRLREQGMATVAFRIARDGSVSDVRTMQSSGFADLDQASINCTAGWSYAPWSAADSSLVQIDYQAQTAWSLRY